MKHVFRSCFLLSLAVLLVSAAWSGGPDASAPTSARNPAHGITFTDRDWAPNDPFVPLNADGDGLWTVYSGVRLGYVPERDDATAALRAARLRNPGLLESLLEHAMTEWIASGAAERQRHPDVQGTAILIRDQAHYDWLQAAWRARVRQELDGYLDLVRAMLTPDRLETLALELDVDAGDHDDLPAFQADWYSRRDDLADIARRMNATVYCVPCEEGQEPAPVCGGQMFSCVDSCINIPSDCQAVVVKPR